MRKIRGIIWRNSQNLTKGRGKKNFFLLQYRKLWHMIPSLLERTSLAWKKNTALHSMLQVICTFSQRRELCTNSSTWQVQKVGVWYRGPGGQGVSLASQLLQFCACAQPPQEQYQLDFESSNQHCVLGEYLPSPFPCWRNSREGTSWFGMAQTDWLPSMLEERQWTILSQNLPDFGC